MLCHKLEVSIFFGTPDLDFDNKCLFSDVRDRNGIWKTTLYGRVVVSLAHSPSPFSILSYIYLFVQSFRLTFVSLTIMPAEGRLRVRDFLATLKTHWWSSAVVCSMVGLLSLWHILHFHSQLNATSFFVIWTYTLYNQHVSFFKSTASL